ncbi:MAG: PEP/pyruvate-binding domain-containing protein [Thermodesulfobacteriota bacterium]|nr:PEP/pyruvate-binding domain-containing protein [Thermodesulfobacteriota bacterium]
MIKSKALEVNIADYHVDVEINAKYAKLQEVMSKYYGLMEGLNTFLKELSHPYKNWGFIVKEARAYCLEYFHLMKKHPMGADAADAYIDIFIEAIQSTSDEGVRTDAVDNLLLFLQKIISDAGSDIERFMPVVNDCFHRIIDSPEAHFFLFVKSFYQINQLAEMFYHRTTNLTSGYKQINLLLLKYYRHTYSYWQKKGDPKTWFEKEAEGVDLIEKADDIFKDISLEKIQSVNKQLDQIKKTENIESEEVLKELVKLPGYSAIVEIYRKTPSRLLEAGKKSGKGNQWKVIFLFHIMNISGLSMIHEEVLRSINRTLSWLISHESHMYIRKLIEKTFSILKHTSDRYPATALNCVLNMGKGVYKTDESDLVNFFIDSVIDLGFEAPMISGVGDDWQIKVNTAHILNIRTWLQLVELNPKWSTRLLSVMIIHLSLGGVFIKDIDLFPRDITRFLNSEIGPVFNLAKQLARIFPVYFNFIGAEGQLRDISTQIDEISHRKDILIHFLRKQSHVESSSQIIYFMEAIFHFWATREKEKLKPFVPPNIYSQIETKGIHLDGVHTVVSHLGEKGFFLPDDLLTIKEKKLRQVFKSIPGAEKKDFKRVELLINLYQLLNQKYNIEHIELNNYITQLSTEAFSDLNVLKQALSLTDVKQKLSELLDYLDRLKQLILSPQLYEIREDIYKKRHITVDIPSMYGSYHEMKFDALGLTFRIESLVNVLFEQLVENIDLSLITKATFYQIYEQLKLFNQALKLDGISSAEIQQQLDLLAHSLEIRGFTFTQYLDIFKGFALAVKNIINDYFNNTHEENLSRILADLDVNRIQAKYLPRETGFDTEKLVYRVSEIFFRDQIALSLGLQQLDLFISRILNTLFQQADKLPKDNLHKLLIYDPENAMTSIHHVGRRVNGSIHLGNKGFNLVKLHNLGLPVPPGFIITTEVFRCKDVIYSYSAAEQNFKEQVVHHISAVEKATGKKFGDPSNPLLFSVRSGSSISQPGMMDTFLDVGINEEITTSLAAKSGNEWFAWDNYRRFLQCYGMAFGLERDDFDAIISELKRRAGISYKRQFTGKQMKKVAFTYRSMIKESGIEIIEDPFEQLYMTIKNVFDSWKSSRAKTFRKIMGISEDWGTAVTVQSMVFGNISGSSGSGVFFTHNPRWSEDTIRLWGDFTLGNQGEDVVAGLVNTLPISISQQDIEMRETDITLESHFPDIYLALKAWANDLIYNEAWSPQEVEFTFETPAISDLYLLQTRDMAMRERKKVIAFDPAEISEEKYLGHGIGISGGAMSGRVVFSLEDIDKWRTLDPESCLILARSDTVPDDIREVFAADGLLTARGGVTSHASVVAHRLGKTCVVGCSDLVCKEKDKKCIFNQVMIESGGYISIDGREGSVYQGLIKVKEA